MENFLFANEQHGGVLWGVIIVLYPFMTCMVDGCAFLASAPFIFGNHTLRPVARLALLCSLAYVPIAFVPLLLDIGQPTRAFHIMITPGLSSPMAIFGFIFSVVVALIAFEAWLTFRPDIVARWERSRPPLRWLYAFLALGVRPVTPESRRIDRRLIEILEILAVPAAVILTGYVGFIFGTVPANPWWSSPLRPLVFLATAAVAGLSLVTVVGIVLRPTRLPDETVRSLARYSIGCFVAVASFCALEVLSIVFPGGTAKVVLSKLFGSDGPLFGSFFYGQLLLGVGAPIALLGFALVFRLHGLRLKLAALVAGALGIAHTFILLWNVVVGGQLVSKSLRGTIDYAPGLGGQKGLIATIVVACLPFVLLAIYGLIVPVFKDEEKGREPPALAPASAGEVA